MMTSKPGLLFLVDKCSGSLIKDIMVCKNRDFTTELEQLKEDTKSTLPRRRVGYSRKLKSLTQRVKKGEDITIPLLHLEERVKKSLEDSSFRISNFPAVNYLKHLPIHTKREEILKALQTNQVIIVSGETGSGKTTQLPLICLEAGFGRTGKIGITQPRRVAATSIASFIEKNLSSSHGIVTHKIRFHSNDTDKAVIKTMTDGVLLTEIKRDPLLLEYDAIIVDEAHERTLNIDFIIGYLKRMRKKRPDFKIIISSATIETEKFSEFFDQAPIIKASGRLFPVNVNYVDTEFEEINDDYLKKLTALVTDILIDSDRGDILIFLPTEADIRETIQKLQGSLKGEASVLPLYGRLSRREQNLIFETSSNRKIIVSTNIAETSLTIPGIKYVIDSGLARVSHYSSKQKIKKLPVEPISQSSANQRTGRAGRIEHGECFRLYSEDTFNEFKEFPVCEIKRSDLAEVILKMKELRLGNIEEFPFLDPPSRSMIRDGVSTLKNLGALDKEEELTTLGKNIAMLPIDPKMGRVLLEGIKQRALRDILIIVSALSIRSPLEVPYDSKEEAREQHKKFAAPESDFLMFLNVWDAYENLIRKNISNSQKRKFCKSNFISFQKMREWRNLYDELLSSIREFYKYKRNQKLTLSFKRAPFDSIHKSLLTGFIENLGILDENHAYLGTKGKSFFVFPGSFQFKAAGKWIIAGELLETSKLYAHTVAKIDPDWTFEVTPHLLKYSYDSPYWDEMQGQVTAFEKVNLWGLPIVKKRRVHFGRINRAESRQIFISDGLVPLKVQGNFYFLKQNSKLIKDIKMSENKVRGNEIFLDETKLIEFYQKNLPDVVNLHELKKYLHKNKDQSYLCIKREDLISEDDLPSLELYPNEFRIGDVKLPLHYDLAPGGATDGVTVTVRQSEIHMVPPNFFDLAIPGWAEPKITALLKNLPKPIRRQFVPIPATSKKLLPILKESTDPLPEALSKVIKKQYDIKIEPELFDLKAISNHFLVRFRVIDDRKKTIYTGRDLKAVQKSTEFSEGVQFTRKREEIECENIAELPDDLLNAIELSKTAGELKHVGYVGLKVKNEQSITKTLFPNFKKAQEETYLAANFLIKKDLTKELKSFDIAVSAALKVVHKEFKKLNLSENITQNVTDLVMQDLFKDSIYTKEEYTKKLSDIKKRVDPKSYPPRLKKILSDILSEVNIMNAFIKKYRFEAKGEYYTLAISRIKDYKSWLLEPARMKLLPLDIFEEYPRYLKGLNLRLERARNHPQKDDQKYADVESYEGKIKSMKIQSKDYFEFFKMLLEWNIITFSPEHKRGIKVSRKSLDKWLDEH
jgi:ATP-dependent helicase HrpA